MALVGVSTRAMRRMARRSVGCGPTHQGGAAAAAPGGQPRLARLRRRCTEQQLVSKTGKRPSAAESAFLVQVLRDCKELVVLQKADEQKIEFLAEAMEEVLAPAGSVILHQGDQMGSMYIVEAGQVSIERKVVGSDVPLKRMGRRGQSFGAVTLLGNTPQKTTVVAKTDCKFWRVDREVFDSVMFAPEEGEEEDSEDEEEEEEDEGDEGAVCSTQDVRDVFIVSDSTGESAGASVRTAMRQFDYCFGTTCGVSRTTVYRFVKSAAEIRQIADLAATKDALIVYTVMGPELRRSLEEACEERSVDRCDLWGALLISLEQKFGAKRSGVTGRKQVVNDEYMTIVKAIEYTRKVDDGVLPNEWKDCDIMLVGPSRAGKTPLAFYLAQRGFKVANYPLVTDEEPPQELFRIDQSKIFALTIRPERLQAIRLERMKQFKTIHSHHYDKIEDIKNEMKWMKNFYIKHGPNWPIIDTTEAGVVETAARILEILDRRKGNSIAAAQESALVGV